MIGNLNLLFAMRDHVPDAHLVKLGTMGEYGQPNIDIEEGYIEIEHKGRKDTLPFPKLPGSLYHCSKVHDSTNIHFACRTWGLRATDLNQGVVYGIETEETARDERLITRFDYDELFGTVLNRFCLQAVIGHPLTVYGAGHQTRGFLNIRDTLACVELAVAEPRPSAASSASSTSSPSSSRCWSWPSWSRTPAEHLGYAVEIQHYENPRVEKEEHYYNAVHTKLLDLGLEPTLLGEELVESMIHAIERHKGSVIESSIDPAHPLEPGEIACRPGVARAPARAPARWYHRQSDESRRRTDGIAQGRGRQARLRDPRRGQPADLRRARRRRLPPRPGPPRAGRRPRRRGLRQGLRPGRGRLRHLRARARPTWSPRSPTRCSTRSRPSSSPARCAPS